MAGVRDKGAPDLHAGAIIWKEITVRGALGVDAPVYRKALDLLAQKFPFDLFSRREVGLDDTSELLTTMAREWRCTPASPWSDCPRTLGPMGAMIVTPVFIQSFRTGAKKYERVVYEIRIDVSESYGKRRGCSRG